MIIPVAAIVTREEPDPARVAHFRELWRAGSRPPPIRVMRYSDASDGNGDRRRWVLYDGHHRLAALRAERVSHVHAELVSLNR